MNNQDQDRRHGENRASDERSPQEDKPNLQERRGADHGQRGVSGEEARRQGLPQAGERGPASQEE